MHDKRRLAPPSPHEGDQRLDMLGLRHDEAFERRADIVELQPQMVLGQDRRGPPQIVLEAEQ
jgi:hypothetical protein